MSFKAWGFWPGGRQGAGISSEIETLSRQQQDHAPLMSPGGWHLI